MSRTLDILQRFKPTVQKRTGRPLQRLRRMNPALHDEVGRQLDFEQMAAFSLCLESLELLESVPDAILERARNQRRDPLQDFGETPSHVRVTWVGYIAVIGIEERMRHPWKALARSLGAKIGCCRGESPRQLAVYRCLGLVRRVLTFAHAENA